MRGTSVSVDDQMSGRRWTLTAGHALNFGADRTRADLVMPDAGLPAVVGRIGATDVYWWLENVTADARVIAEHLGGPDFVVVPTGMAIPIPFAATRVLVAGPAGVVAFAVTADTYRAREITDPNAAGGSVRLLDEDAKYFRVLVALCEPALSEPALRGSWQSAIPTSAEIVERLRSVAGYESVTITSVNFHLNYLCTQKLPDQIEAYARLMEIPPQTLARMRRTVLVQLAVRFNLVSRDHLRLLG